MSFLQAKPFQVWQKPGGQRIRLIAKKIKSGDSTWLAILLPAETDQKLPHRFEKVVVMDRYLRGCTLISGVKNLPGALTPPA